MHRACALSLVALLAGSCVQAFDGSKIEIFFHSGVQVPNDTDPGNGRPPSDTHYEMYVVQGLAVFKLIEFEIRPAIIRADPCFIETDADKFPGLHSTMVAQAERQVAAAAGYPPDEAGLVADADVRVGNMASLETLKVITSHQAGLTNATIQARLALVPAPTLMDAQSNATRLSMCKQIFADYPGYYVGTDKVLTIPIGGTYYGIVEGLDPRSNSLLGGGSFTVDASFPNMTALRVNWQFNDPNDPRRDALHLSPSAFGWHYMAGVPVSKSRGAISVSMRNIDFPSIAGEAAIYTQLDQDSVQL